jgi:CheY-specific phosphatase CheX
MAYRIGIVTKNLSFFKLLDQERRSSVDFEMILAKSKDALRQVENTGKYAESFIFDSSLSVEDILSLGTYIKNSDRYKGVKIFLALENFDTFQTITTSDIFSNSTIINMPLSASEIYKKITVDTAQLQDSEINKSKATKTVSSANFLNIFIECTMATVQEMAQCLPLTHSAPEILNYDKLPQPVAIRGKLAINSSHFTGSFFIAFPESTFLKICTVVLMEKVEKIDKENEDLVSELCNIIYGKSKVLIAKLDMKLDMVIPTYNKDKQIVSKDNILLVKLNSDMGDFYVKVAPGLL